MIYNGCSSERLFMLGHRNSFDKTNNSSTVKSISLRSLLAIIDKYGRTVSQ